MIVNEQRHAPVFYGLLGLLSFLLLLLQQISFFSFKIGHAYPQLLLALLLAMACLLGEWTSFWYGLCLGLALDSLAGRASLFNAVTFMVLAVAVGLIYRYWLNKNLKAVLLGGLGASLLYHLLKWFVLYVLRGEPGAVQLLLYYALPSAVYTGFAVLPFYFLVKRLQRRYAIAMQ